MILCCSSTINGFCDFDSISTGSSVSAVTALDGSSRVLI